MCSFRFSFARKPLPQNGHKCGRPGSYSGGGAPVLAAAAAAATAAAGIDGGRTVVAAAVGLGIGGTGGRPEAAAAAAATAAAALKSRIKLCHGPAADGPAPVAGEGPIEVLVELLLLPSPSSDPSRSELGSPSWDVVRPCVA